jgi:nicotinamidase-related amidase
MLLGPHDALLVLDVQRDFLPGGTLAIAEGDVIVPILNEYIQLSLASDAHVFVARDWHPREHCSFRSRGGPWPPHCIQNTRGAEFAAELNVPREAQVLSKGENPDREAWSAFDDTRLQDELAAGSVDRLIVGGLATDQGVLRTVREARSKHYAVALMVDATRGMDETASAHARKQMVALGAVAVTLEPCP